MKIKKISNNKIKIELCKEEITKWSVIANTKIPDYNAMIVELLTAAEKETGISFRNCRLMVEAMRSDDEKYVVFVSRQGKAEKSPYPVNNSVKRRIVAEFDDLETICMFDRHYPIYATLLQGANSLYSFRDLYYLDITIPGKFSSYADALAGNLSEFSVNAAGTDIPLLLAEHARCLIPRNALQTLRKMN